MASASSFVEKDVGFQALLLQAQDVLQQLKEEHESSFSRHQSEIRRLRAQIEAHGRAPEPESEGPQRTSCLKTGGDGTGSSGSLGRAVLFSDDSNASQRIRGAPAAEAARVCFASETSSQSYRSGGMAGAAEAARKLNSSETSQQSNRSSRPHFFRRSQSSETVGSHMTTVSRLQRLMTEIDDIVHRPSFHGARILGRSGDLLPQTMLAPFVNSHKFEAFFACLIIVNVVVMAFEAEFDGIDIGTSQGLQPGTLADVIQVPPGANRTFSVLHWIFGVLFTLEIVLKFLACHCIFFKDPMNWLDTLIVSFWLLGVCGVGLGVKAQFGRLLRLVKVLRLLRIARAIQSLDALFLMTTALKGSIMTLSWAVVIFVATLSFFALLMSQVFGEFYFPDQDQPLETRQEVYVYFGTFTRALFTMFELTFANWPPVSRMLFERVNIWFMLLTVIYKLTLGFAVVGVINGVFMQETFKVAALDDNIMVRQKRVAQKAHRDKMRRLFKSADTDGDGVLNRAEFRDVLEDREVTQWLAAMEFPACHTAQDISRLFDYLDTDNDDSLTMEELVKGVSRLQGSSRSIDMKVLQKDVDEILQLLKTPSTVKSSKSGLLPSRHPSNHHLHANCGVLAVRETKPLHGSSRLMPAFSSSGSTTSNATMSEVQAHSSEVREVQATLYEEVQETQTPTDNEPGDMRDSSPISDPIEEAVDNSNAQVASSPSAYPAQLEGMSAIVDDGVSYSRV